jgi:hypothetical protein
MEVAKASKKKTGLVATGNVDVGMIEDGRNVVKSFKAGEDVDLGDDQDTIDNLIKLGAIKRDAQEALPAPGPTDPEKAAADQQRQDAQKTYDASPKLKLQFAAFDDYFAALTAAK